MKLDSRFIRVAHDPGDPQLCAHCPFCGSGQITGRSDGGIDCAFCGMSFIVRVQPAFPGMPQAPGQGAPTDVGPDAMGMPPGMDPAMMGGDPAAAALPPGADGEMPPGEEDAPPDGDEDGGEDGPPDGGDGPGDDDGEDDSRDAPPFRKKSSVRSYATLAGDQLPEGAYVRHLAVLFAGDQRKAVLARLRTEAVGDPEYRRHYSRGWRAAQNPGASTAGISPLERADDRDEPASWYDGYHDYTSDRPRWHSRECPAADHDAPGCTLWEEEAQ